MRLLLNALLWTVQLGCASLGFAQSENVILEGYVFEDNNSGYLNEVKIQVLDAESGVLYGDVSTNREGFFAVEVPLDHDFMVRASKAVFESVETVATSKNLTAEKVFVKISMGRAPGYRLEVTLAEEADPEKYEVDAISGSLIEVYNNTTDKEILVLKDHPSPYFSFQLEQGNHYTLLIRSPRFFTKRIESFVNIDGCILCMDGVSEIGPGVSDNLAYGNEMGTLLANIELQKLEVDSAIALDNIYYDYNSSKIRTDAEFELEKVVELLKVNPSIVVELGSHTDSRGKAPYNRSLSQKRAEAAVAYITAKGIQSYRLSAQGYGETKPVNICVDGVECDEDEYALNRRTELKITGFTTDPFDGKPLSEIIAEESLDALLEEVMGAGEYRVPEGGAAPTNPTQPTADVDESTGVDKAVSQLEALKGDLSKAPKSKVNPNSPEGTAMTASTPSENERPAKVKSTISVIVPEQSITNAKPLTMPTGAKYTGYRVLVFQSGTSLADDNGELFFKFGTLKEDELADGSFGYMSGAFRTEIEARSYLGNVQSLFPEARLLRYVNGFIIENTQ
ncbi:MAG: OmpA family protein [Saprospiraceae bacterium]